MLVVACGFSLN